MTPPVTSSSSNSNTTENNSATTAAGGPPTVDKYMFLKLLVAQIRNQDPLNPADSAQYLTQLAQFTQLEQTQSISSDLTAIRQHIEQLVQKADPGTTTQS